LFGFGARSEYTRNDRCVYIFRMADPALSLDPWRPLATLYLHDDDPDDYQADELDRMPRVQVVPVRSVTHDGCVYAVTLLLGPDGALELLCDDPSEALERGEDTIAALRRQLTDRSAANYRWRWGRWWAS